MPHRKNIRFAALLFGVVLLCVASVTGIVLIARTDEPQSTLYASIVGFPSLIVMQLLQMLRNEAATTEAVEEITRAVEPVAQEVKSVSEKLEPVMEEVRVVAKKLSNGGRLDSREELKLLIAEVIREGCYGHMQNPPKVQT